MFCFSFSVSVFCFLLLLFVLFVFQGFFSRDALHALNTSTFFSKWQKVNVYHMIVKICMWLS